MHHIPNIISVIRILLIIPIAMLLHQKAWTSVFWLMLLAGFSDALDGFLARTFNWQSRLGAILDPLADKALLVFVFLSLAHKGIIPVWLAALVVVRDIIILAGAISYRWLFKDIQISPLFISKINTAVQILFVFAIMYHLAFSGTSYWQLSLSVVNSLQSLVVLTTIVSGVAYVLIWLRNANVRSKQLR